MGTKIGRILYTHAEPNNIKDPNAVSVAGAKKKNNVLTTQQWKGHSQRETSKESWCRIGLEVPCEYQAKVKRMEVMFSELTGTQNNFAEVRGIQ